MFDVKHGQLFFLAFEVPLAAVTSGTLLWRFMGRHGTVPPLVAVTVGSVWFMCLVLPVLLPLDLAEALVQRCHALHGESYTGCETSQVDPSFVGKVWRFCFWFCFAMSWLILPLASSYLLAGAFSVRKRILFALRDRLYFFLSIGTLCGALLLLLILRFQLSLLGLSGVVISLANIFGVIVATLMLSYGLVELPKFLWSSGNYESRLQNCEYRATHTMERVEEAKASMAKALGDINLVMALYENSKAELPQGRRQVLKGYIKLIQDEVPPLDESTLTMPKAIVDETKHCSLTEEFLAALRYKVRKNVVEFRKVHYLWRKRCAEAFHLQDLLRWKRGELTEEGLASSSSSSSSSASSRLLFNFRIYVVPIVARLAAVLSALLTSAFIWSEATLWSILLPQKLDLSVFSILLHHTSPPYVVVQLVCFLCVSYLFFCLFFGIFRFRLFLLYELVPKHTDPFTLVLNAMLCSRLLVPLAYNFTTVMHETSFSTGILFGDEEAAVADGGTTSAGVLPLPQIALLHRGMEEVPIFGVGFNLYFPAVIVLFALLTLCRVWDRVMNTFDLNTYSFEGVGDERLEAYGRNLLAQERAKWMNLNRSAHGGPPPSGYVDVSAGAQLHGSAALGRGDRAPSRRGGADEDEEAELPSFAQGEMSLGGYGRVPLEEEEENEGPSGAPN